MQLDFLNNKVSTNLLLAGGKNLNSISKDVYFFNVNFKTPYYYKI